jgi:PIN domain nuclease of toxin-antitoxin system
MNRAQVIAKIKAMLSLQESTDFDGEAAAAANLIDKLCKQHGISVDDAVKPENS